MPSPQSAAAAKQRPNGHRRPVVRPGRVSESNCSPSPERERGKIHKSRFQQSSNLRCKSAGGKTSMPPVESSSSGKGVPESYSPRQKSESPPSPPHPSRGEQSPSTATTRQTDDAATEKNEVPPPAGTTACSECSHQSSSDYNPHSVHVQAPSDSSPVQRAQPKHQAPATSETMTASPADCCHSRPPHSRAECGHGQQSTDDSGVGHRNCPQPQNPTDNALGTPPSPPLITYDYSSSSHNTPSEEKCRTPGVAQPSKSHAKLNSEQHELPPQQKTTGYIKQNKSQLLRSPSPPTLCSKCRLRFSSYTLESAQKRPEGTATKPQPAPYTPCQKTFESKDMHLTQMSRDTLYEILSTPYDPLFTAYSSRAPGEQPIWTGSLNPQQVENNTANDLLWKPHDSIGMTLPESQSRSARSLIRTQQGGHFDHPAWQSDVTYLPQKYVVDPYQNIYSQQPSMMRETCWMPTETYQNPPSRPVWPHVILEERPCNSFVRQPADAESNTWFQIAMNNVLSPSREELEQLHSHKSTQTDQSHHSMVMPPELLEKERSCGLEGLTFPSTIESQDYCILPTDAYGPYSFFPPSPLSGNRQYQATEATAMPPFQSCVPPMQGRPVQLQAVGPASPTPPPILVGAGPPCYATAPANMWLQCPSASDSDSSSAPSSSCQMWDYLQFVRL